MKQRFLIPLAALLLVGCATKTDPCGDGMARADDGNCYPLSGAADDTGTNNQSDNQLPDADGDFDSGPPPDDGGDFDGGEPPDDGGGPGSCEADEDCTDRCFDEGYDCVCDPAPRACVPACNAAGECPSPFTCNTTAVSASGVSGICTPESGPPGGP